MLILVSDQKLYKIDELENGFAYYRVFCFASIDAMDSNQQTSIFATLRDLTNSKNLIVYYNAQNASIFIDPIAVNFHSNPKLVYVVNRDANYRKVNLFDQTFGEFERTQSIAVTILSFAFEKCFHLHDMGWLLGTSSIWSQSILFTSAIKLLQGANLQISMYRK